MRRKDLEDKMIAAFNSVEDQTTTDENSVSAFQATIKVMKAFFAKLNEISTDLELRTPYSETQGYFPKTQTSEVGDYMSVEDKSSAENESASGTVLQESELWANDNSSPDAKECLGETGLSQTPPEN